MGSSKLDYVHAVGGRHGTFFDSQTIPLTRPTGRIPGPTRMSITTTLDGGARLALRRSIPHRAPIARRVKDVTITYEDVTARTGQMQWDDVFDVVCTGSGPGGLAAAIAAADAGLTVFVADSGGGDGMSGMPISGTETLPCRLGTDVLDTETIDYLDALTRDLGSLNRFAPDFRVPVRLLDETPPVDLGRGPVETFVGARLRDWAAGCLASPYGVIYSHVSNRNMTTMRSRVGGAIEAAIIGSIEPDPERPGLALADWLFTQACDRGIEVHTASPPQRLVFEGGQVTGAVVTTTAGPRALRARHTVVMATGGNHLNTSSPRHSLAGQSSVQVGLVSQTASRFGRLELLAKA